MWFLLFCTYISLIKSTEPYYDKSNEADISQCNYGIYDKNNFDSNCNCFRVIGNGPSCNINVSFNNTHYYMTEICLLDDSILWEKNLKVLNEPVNITRKDKDIITGIINEKTNIKVIYFCEKAYKKVYPVLRPTKETTNVDDYLESLENKIEDVKKDISQCNYGIYDKNSFDSNCNCFRVIGNGPSCNINITFNNTHYYMTENCLLDDSILWEKNLKVLNEHVDITRKDKDIITGIINEKTYIKVMYFCEKAYKKVYPVPRPRKETANMDDYWESLENKIEGVKKDISQCNYGIYDKNSFDSICNCSRVIGNGPECNINITFNNTHYYMTEICLLDESILWQKNLKVLNEHMDITRKDKDIIIGIINEKTYIKVMYFCEKAYKKVYPVLRPTKETANINDYLESLENKIEDVEKGIRGNRVILCLLSSLGIFFIVRCFWKKIKKKIHLFQTQLRYHYCKREPITFTETVHNSDHNSSHEGTEEFMDSPLENRGNHDSETQRELVTFTETVHDSDHNSSKEETELDVGSSQESRGSNLQEEYGSRL